MTEDVLVSVKGFHTMEGMETVDEIEVISPGKYYMKNGKHYVFYEEKIEDSGETIKNRITLKDDCLEMQKRGAVTTSLVFEKGKKNSSNYITPFGNMISTVSVSRMEIYQTEECLTLKVDYELELNYEHAADCHIEIVVSEKKPGAFRID